MDFLLNEETEGMDWEDCGEKEQEEVETLLEEIFGEGEEDQTSEEMVMDEEDPDVLNENDHKTQANNNEEHIFINERKFMVGEQALLQLIKRSRCEECGDNIVPSSVVEGEKICSGVKYKFVCRNGHPGKWISTPFYGGRSVMNLLLQLMILLSGTSWERFEMGAKFINLNVGSARHFYQMQLQYRVAIENFFKDHIAKVRQSLSGIPLSIAVDVRYDTPGFCASRSTAVFMDTVTKAIVHMEIGDSREVGRHSPRMEKLLVERGLMQLVHHSNLVIWEVTSDASKTITTLLKTDPFKHLQHSLDVWHKAKKLASMLAELAKKSAHRDLLPWIRPLVNHFWWCCSSCKGSVNNLLKRWMAILHHVTNNHVWPGGRCYHHEGVSTDQKTWLRKDSPTLKELRKIVTNRNWCGSMGYYVNCQQTWAVENFFSHILLHYCPKQNSYSYDSYSIRNMLAVMDHNYHRDRESAVNQEGVTSTQAQVSRRTKQWVAYERRRPKEFKYISDLMATCMLQTYGKPLATFSRSKEAISLDSVARNLSGKPNPGSQYLLTDMKSRKK